MKRLAVSFLWFLITPLQAQDFSLQQVSELFPSAGFEAEIHFWRQMFTRYGEKQVVFHDRRDLRLIYEVVHFDRGIADDPEEAERQGEVLKHHRENLEQQLRQLARGVNPDDYTEEQSGIVRALHRLGYDPGPRLYRTLSEQLRFQRGIKEEFRRGIERSGRYIKDIEQVLDEYGLPRELAVLPHIESSFRHEAHSKAGAVGLWQFVRGTGRLYMTVNSYIDERFDPLESTRAAAQLLKSNLEVLGSWPLAVTAYNHGTNGMKRARRRYGADMVKIARNYRSRLFGFASRNFYPEFLAALEVYRNQENYFEDLQLEPRVQFDTFRLPRSHRVADVLKAEAVGLEELKSLNPALRPRVWRSGRIPGGFLLRLPTGAADQVAAVLEKAEPMADAPVRVAENGTMRYRVRRGDALSTIASRFGVSSRSLAAANSISNRHMIRVGQVLSIPSGGRAVTRPTKYRVRRGDSLSTIASRFGVTARSLAAANSISNRNLIRAGQVLSIPAGDTVARPTRYRVRRGDTLLEIAARFGRSLRALVEANNLRNANRIFLGQVLLIP